MSFFTLIQYLRHHWCSTRIDVLHSPSIYKLYQDVIKRPSMRSAQMRSLKASLRGTSARKVVLLNSFHFLFGFNKNPKQNFHLASLIYRLIQSRNDRFILEVGRSKPLIHEAILFAIRDQQVAWFKTILNDINYEMPREEQFSLNDPTHLDFVYFHAFENADDAYAQFVQLTKMAHKESAFVLEGIYSNKAMSMVWNRIKNESKTTVTVDLFHLGIVYFRTNQHPQHFRLRYFPC